MIEKVNPSHPDKVADRIAGAIVDLAYKKDSAPKIAVEVLIGHGNCHIIAETSVKINEADIEDLVVRIAKPAGELYVQYDEVPQDAHLADNQAGLIRCGDNGIFKGVPVDREVETLGSYVRYMYEKFPTDGKFIYDMDGSRLIICQSNATREELAEATTKGLSNTPELIINPLGDWTGGVNVDTGATNRKLGSDMGRAVTGGGLHGKDLSKADVTLNIYAHIKAQTSGQEVNLCCAIGDDTVDGLPYEQIVEAAKDYVFNEVGGFEKLAEWGLV